MRRGEEEEDLKEGKLNHSKRRKHSPFEFLLSKLYFQHHHKQLRIQTILTDPTAPKFDQSPVPLLQIEVPVVLLHISCATRCTSCFP
jgi:hypothetical protein